jgi:MFS family permease
MGSWTEHMGEWMETTALLWLINQMTHSPFMGTLMVTLRFLPLVVFAYIGGIIADRVDRRFLLMNALAAGAALSIALAALVHFGVIESWHLLLYSVISGMITSFNHPARNSLVPNLVEKEHYLNAITLDNATVMSSRMLGAPLAGFIIGFAGTTPVLGLRAVGAIGAIMWLIRVQTPAVQFEIKKRPFSSFAEGISYVGKHKIILTQILLYLLPIFVTNSYTGLLPYVATDKLHVDSDLYGIMQAAPGAGAVIAILMLAPLIDFHRKGLLILLAGIAQGVFLVFFAVSPAYLLSVLLLVFIGGTNTTFMTLNNTVIQEMLPDKVRGRVMSLREVAFGLGPAGSLISGAIAGVLGVTVALSVAGSLSILVLLGVVLVFPQRQGHDSSASL